MVLKPASHLLCLLYSMDKRQQIIQEIQRVARDLSKDSLSAREFTTKSHVSESQVSYHFGSWNEAVAAAGLKPNPVDLPPTRESIAEEDLLTEIGRIWLHSGRRPTIAAMNSAGQYSVWPYQNRWGSFPAAVNEYVRRFGEPTLEQATEVSPPQTIDRTLPLLIPNTKKPSPETSRKRVLYGEPIDFRGLRYGPINEQGVVYLFGMVSRELGFLIESIRTDFPDCEGKRALDKDGNQWQHVRIEFEYRSKNFFEHGHDPDACDLIVCWIHNWADCPLEVLELKSTIGLLPRK